MLKCQLFLQDANKRTYILVHKDAALRKVIPVDRCQQFAMSKHLTRHFLGKAPESDVEV